MGWTTVYTYVYPYVFPFRFFIRPFTWEVWLAILLSVCVYPLLNFAVEQLSLQVGPLARFGS